MENYEDTKMQNKRICPFLNYHEFMSMIGTRLDLNTLINNVIKEYDERFGVTFLYDTTGKILKVY
jgi:hypothetical protein